MIKLNEHFFEMEEATFNGGLNPENAQELILYFNIFAREKICVLGGERDTYRPQIIARLLDVPTNLAELDGLNITQTDIDAGKADLRISCFNWQMEEVVKGCFSLRLTPGGVYEIQIKADVAMHFDEDPFMAHYEIKAACPLSHISVSVPLDVPEPVKFTQAMLEKHLDISSFSRPLVRDQTLPGSTKVVARCVFFYRTLSSY